MTADAELAERVRLLRSHGEQPALPPPDRRHDRTPRRAAGRAAAGQAAPPRRLQRRPPPARRALREGLAGTSVELPAPAFDGADHVYHLFIVRTTERDALREHLDEHGVSTAVHYPFPIHRTEAYAELGLGRGQPARSPSGWPRRSARCRCSRRCPTTRSAQRDRRGRRPSTGGVMTMARKDRFVRRTRPTRSRAAERRRRRLRLLGPEPRPQRHRAPRARARRRCASATPSAPRRSRERYPACRCSPTSTTCSRTPTIDAVARRDAAADPPRDRAAPRCEAGKHVLVEKPLAKTSAEARDLIEIAAAARPRADAGPHVPLQPAGQQGQRPDRRRARSARSTS